MEAKLADMAEGKPETCAIIVIIYIQSSGWPGWTYATVLDQYLNCSSCVYVPLRKFSKYAA